LQVFGGLFQLDSSATRKFDFKRLLMDTGKEVNVFEPTAAYFLQILSGFAGAADTAAFCVERTDLKSFNSSQRRADREQGGGGVSTRFICEQPANMTREEFAEYYMRMAFYRA
jgi:hypothetical protein